MIIRWTHAQLDPIAKRLKRMGDQHRPSEIPPERWAKIVNGKSCHLTFQEMDVIARVLGWDVLLAPVRRRIRAKHQARKVLGPAQTHKKAATYE